MLLLKLDRNDGKPIFRQIMDQILHLIQSGGLETGAKLPSTRSFAQRHRVNRSTVYRAYQELWALGYIECRPGSYSFVRGRAPLHSVGSTAPSDELSWEKKTTPAAQNCLNRYKRLPPPLTTDKRINFSPMSLDPNLIPVKDFQIHLNRSIRSHGASLLGYGDPKGCPGLRKTISNRMKLHGISTTEDEILITNGAQQAMELVLKLLVQRDTPVIVEAPTYSSAIPLFQFFRPKILGAPMTREGMDLEVLEDLIQRHRPTLVYTMPNFHNPTGITTSQLHRERLLNLCEKYEVLLLEDGFEEEMKYFGKTVLPIKSMDEKNCVVYIGTFSKVLFPGLRVGWIAAGKNMIEKLSALKASSDIASPPVNQAALDSYCRAGGYDLHLKQIHRKYRRRMQTALRSVSRYLPATNMEVTRPSGGYTFWIDTPRKMRFEKDMLEDLKTRGVLVSKGSQYYFSPPLNACFRVSIAHRSCEEIEEGIKRIGETLAKWI